MGGVKYLKLHNIAKETRNLWFLASYISSRENRDADLESRDSSIEAEYSLDPQVFQKIISTLGDPVIDLFASRANAKCRDYGSWKKDPDSLFVDAFTRRWSFFLLCIPTISNDTENSY